MHGNIHNGAGLAAFLLILIAMISAAYRFRHEPNWRPQAAPTTALAALGIIAFVLIPMLGNNHFGLAQRLFVGTFVAWILTTAAHARNGYRFESGWDETERASLSPFTATVSDFTIDPPARTTPGSSG